MMKSISFRKNAFVAAAVAVSTLFLASCNKNNDADVPQQPVSALMAFNLAPDVSAAIINLSGGSITQSPLSFPNFTGGYISVYSGDREINSFNYATNSDMVDSSFAFEENKYYSLFVVGTEGNYDHVIRQDNYDSLSSTSGMAYVRYINAIPDSAAATVKMSMGENTVVNENAAYKTVSEFEAMNPGELMVALNSEAGVDTSRTFNIEQNKVYTVLLIGEPGATSDNRKVQIRYVENGSLSQ